LKTRARQFQVGKLAWVKALSTKYQRTKDLGLKMYRGAELWYSTTAEGLGNRLLKWSKKLEDRTISGIRGKLLLLSGLDESRIPVALGRGVSTKSYFCFQLLTD